MSRLVFSSSTRIGTGSPERTSAGAKSQTRIDSLSTTWRVGGALAQATAALAGGASGTARWAPAQAVAADSARAKRAKDTTRARRAGQPAIVKLVLGERW